MNEWQHTCKVAGRVLLIPHGEPCDRCGTSQDPEDWSSLEDFGHKLVSTTEPSEVAARICREVAELPDRNSPEDWPEAMLVTHDELRRIVLSALGVSPSGDQTFSHQTPMPPSYGGGED